MQFQFDASQVDPAQGIEIWPDNTWVKVVATAHKPVASRTNEKSGMLLWTLQAVEGPLQGKTQFLRHNLWNENEQAANIAKQELSAMIWVTLGANQGRLNINDFSEIQNIPFFILSRHGFNNNTKQTTQDWGGYKDINGNDAGKQTPGGGGAAAPQFGGAPTGQAPAFGGAPQGQPQQQAPAFGQPQQAAPQQQAPAFGGGFGQPAPQQPAQSPGFAPQGAPAFGAPPATSAAPQFQQQQPAQQFQPQGQPQQPQQPAFGGGGFAPPAGQSPAGAPPWGAR